MDGRRAPSETIEGHAIRHSTLRSVLASAALVLGMTAAPLICTRGDSLYGQGSDMWMDGTSVNNECALPPEIEVDGVASLARPAIVTCSSPTPDVEIHYTLDGSEPIDLSLTYDEPVEVTSPRLFRAVAFAKGLRPSPCTAAMVAGPSGPAGCIGVNFVADSDDKSQILGSGQIAGLGDDAQGFWNNVPARSGWLTSLLDHSGASTAVSLEVSGDARPLRGEPLGFEGNNAMLKRGNVGPAPTVRLRGIPFARFDVLVHLGAGDNNVQGMARLSSGDVETGSCAFNFGWNGGIHVFTKAAPSETAECANAILFRHVTASDIAVTVERTSGKGWLGIAGMQILPR